MVELIIFENIFKKSIVLTKSIIIKMKQNNNIFDYALDQDNLIKNREDLRGRLAIEISKEEKDRNNAVIQQYEALIEAINYQLDNRSTLNALPMMSAIPVNPLLYPNFAKMANDDNFKALVAAATVTDTKQLALDFKQNQTGKKEVGYPAKNEDEVKIIASRLTSKKKFVNPGAEQLAELAEKRGWIRAVTGWNSEAKATEKETIDASDIERIQNQVLDFLSKAKDLMELITFVKNLREESSYYNTASYDEILNNVIGSLAIDKKAPKDNIYIKLINDIVEPMFVGNASSSIVANAIMRLSTDFDIHQETASDILISMVYRYSRFIAKDETEAIKIQNDCWKCLVFDPEQAAKDAELKGYFQSTGIFQNDSEIVNSLAEMSDAIASRILGEGEIEELKKEKKIKFKSLLDAAEEIPAVVKDIVKSNPPAEKKTHPAKAGKHGKNNKKK